MGRDTYYDILGAPTTASPDEIKAKYRRLIRRIHPDLDGPAALFRQVQQAYEVLSDPGRRAAYDRSLEAVGGAPPTASGSASTKSPGGTESDRPRRDDHFDSGRGRPAGAGPSNGSVRRTEGGSTTRESSARSFLNRHPARAVAIGGSALLVVGAALDNDGSGVMMLGAVALIIAAVAGLGGRGAREREAYQRSGMAAVDAMTGRQFQVLLEHLFANQGYRVARLGVRRSSGAGLLLEGTNGRTIVQVKRWTGVVRHEAVQEAAVARAHYGAARALVVTSSNYSQQAVTVANSNGVTLWNRTILASELAEFRGRSGVKKFSSDLRAGSRICLGFVAALFVVLVAANANARRRWSSKRRGE